MPDDDLFIIPSAWEFVATFKRGQIRLPRVCVKKLAAAALAFLSRFDTAALAEVIAPYLPERSR